MMSGQLANLNMLQEIFRELDRLSKLSEMPRRIELCRRALAMISRETQPELWAALQDDLASSLAQTPVGSRAENIEQAIYHFKQALEVRIRQRYQREWASTKNNLATAYRDRIRGERAENIEQAIKYYQEALEVRTRQTLPRDWAQTQFNLAGAYFWRIRGKRAENIEGAIQGAQQALDVYTRESFPYFWAQTLNLLGEAYRVRIQESRRENIEQAIGCFQAAMAVQTRQAFPEDWAAIQNNLGNAYQARILGVRAENIEQAISYFMGALDVRTRQYYPELWAQTQYNLGNAYRNRIRGNQVENIKQAIFHFEQALEIRTRQAFPEYWAQTHNNLGNAYLAHIRSESAENNIEQAIYHYEKALEIHTPQAFPEHWAQTQHNLGNAYLARMRGRQEANIEKAIHYFQQALTVRTHEDFPADWAQTHNNLAGAYGKRIGGDPTENIELTIYHLKQALEVRTPQTFPTDWAETHNNLAIAYGNRKKGERTENVEQAIHHYLQALDVYTYTAFPDQCLKTARALAYIAFEEQRWELASNAYDIAFDAQEVILRATFTRTSKQMELTEVQNLAPRAAFAHVRGGNIKKAVEVLEQGRAQLLRESIERRRQDLEELPTLGFDSLYKAYKQATEEFNSLQNRGVSESERPKNWMEQMERAWEKVLAASAAIRIEVGQRHPQYRYFLQALSFDEIQKQAQDNPLVYLTATSAGGLALVVTGQDVKAIELPELDQKSLHKQIWSPSDEEIDRINAHLHQGNISLEDIQAVSGGYFSTYALWNLTPYLTKTSEKLIQKLFDAWQETLDATTRWLWEVCINDLIPILKKSAAPATLIPAGQLAILPLHAAWIEDRSKPTHRRYALDEININYSPSAYALLQASLGANRPTESLMAVNNPDRSLRFTEYEMQAALDMFQQSKHLHGNDATIDVVKREMQTAQVLHFATHGRAGWEKEEQAQLKLADGYLTLPNIFELNLSQVRLAVLSACETGVPSLKLIDEMIGLPAGMMQAGVPGVVGSLWSVSDMRTAMLMARFYNFWRVEGQTPQEALRQAQIWLRDSTSAQKKNFLKSFIKKKSSGISILAALSFYKYLSSADPRDVDFSSPYYWAAFTYTGV